MNFYLIFKIFISNNFLKPVQLSTSFKNQSNDCFFSQISPLFQSQQGKPNTALNIFPCHSEEEHVERKNRGTEIQWQSVLCSCLSNLAWSAVHWLGAASLIFLCLPTVSPAGTSIVSCYMQLCFWMHGPLRKWMKWHSKLFGLYNTECETPAILMHSVIMTFKLCCPSSVSEWSISMAIQKIKSWDGFSCLKYLVGSRNSMETAIILNCFQVLQHAVQTFILFPC